MTIDDVKAEIERGQAEAVKMLDRWGFARGKDRRVEFCNIDGKCVVELFDPAWQGRKLRSFYGDSPEAARANAAEAIRSDLP